MLRRRPVIGFIGLGNMGRPMATNLIQAGYSLVVYDLRTEPVRTLEALGARVCSSNREVAEHSDIVLTVLPTSKEVREAILGTSGVAEGLRPGTILVEMSSVESETIAEVAAAVAPSGAHVIDAAISGVEEDAERRQLVIMAAGSRAIIDSCADVLAALGKSVVYVGELGLAKAMKTATAMLGALNVLGATEVATWAVRRGLELRLLHEVVRQVPGHARGSAEIIAKVLEGRFKPRPSWTPKDLGFGLRAAADLRVPMPFAAVSQQLFLVAKALGYDGYEVTGIACRVYEALSGVKLTASE